MHLTSRELLRDLGRIDWLIAVLDTAEESDEEDIDDLKWLYLRGAFIRRLLAARQTQKGEKIVDLSIWRSGSNSPGNVAARAA